MTKTNTLGWISFPLLFIPLVLTFCLSTFVWKSNDWTAFYICYTIACLVTFGTLLLILKKNDLSLKDIGFRDFRLSHIAWGILFFGIACVWCTGIALILKYGFGLSKDWLIRIHFTQPYHPVVMLIAVVIIGPVTEECLFRGFFLTVMKDKLNLWMAGLISAFLFGAYYYYFTGLAGALLILFWSPLPLILFIRKKSIYPGIVLHMVNNLFPYVIIKLLSDLAVVQTLSKIGLL